MSNFLKDSLKNAPPYIPGEQLTGVIKLNTNESPYSPSPKAIAAIEKETNKLMRYPQVDANDTRKALARRLNIKPENVFVGNGSDEVLRLCFQAYLEFGSKAAWSTPTYSLYEILAGFAGAKIIDVRRRDDFTVDIEALAKVGADLTIIASPNSPTGTLTPLNEIDELASKVKLLLVDEAYADFAGITASKLIDKRKNLIVARSLSKSYSLAGLRVGFAVADNSIIDDFMLLKDSYNVSRIANAAAEAALDDTAYFETIRTRILSTRRRLEEGLSKRGWKVFESGANFVFAVPPDRDGGAVYKRLLEEKILVRWFGNDPRTAVGVRITVGTDEEISRLLEVIGE